MKNKKRWIAMLLCLAMAMTLLPMSALAARGNGEWEETPADKTVDSAMQAERPENPADDEAAAETAALYPDAANETWTQANTALTDANYTIAKTADGHLRFTTKGITSNNGDSTPGPAVFMSNTMTEKLKPNDSGVYEVSFKLKPLSDGQCLGVYLNFKKPVNGALIGYNTPGAWFWQNYNGTTNPYGDCLGSAPNPLTANTTYEFVVTWNPTAKTSTMTVNGAKVVENQSYATVADTASIGVVNNLGIKLGKSNDGVHGDVEVWDVHYSGQEPLPSIKVSGTVKSNKGEVLEGVAIAATPGDYTATTDQDGKYELTVPSGQTYTLTAKKAGYVDTTDTVQVGEEAVTKDLTLTAMPVLSGTVTADGTEATIAGATVTVSSGETTVVVATTDEEGKYSVSVPKGTYTLTAAAATYESKAEENVAITADLTKDFALKEDLADYHVLESTGMKVLVRKTFPQVVEYRLTDGSRMDGQKLKDLNTIKINGTAATLGTVTSELSANK